MVSKKNSERGLVGCRVPVIPKARRSIRKKVSCKKRVDEGQLCPFELLATVAGKLLQEAEASASVSSSAAGGLDRLRSRKDQVIKQEEIEGQDDQGSSEESVVSSGRQLVNKCSGMKADKVNIIDSSACSLKMGISDMKSANEMDGGGGGSPKCDYYSDAKSVDKGITAGMGESAVGSDDNIISTTNKSNGKDEVRKRKRSIPNIDTNEDAANNLFEKVSLGKGSLIPDASFLTGRNDVKTGGSVYEDEILSQFFYQSNSNMKAHIGGGRRTSDSKIWSSCPKLKDLEGNDSGDVVNNIDQIKKMKLLDPSSVVTQDCGISSESVSNLSKKGLCEDVKSNPGIGGVQSPRTERHRSFTCRNSPVKLSIKSFEVPELVIEVGESTTVGSLKKTILEAVGRVFGEGLSVGLLDNGKRICDDGRSLLESGGVCDEKNLDNLGFVLEPNSNITKLSSPAEDSGTIKEENVNRSQLIPKVEVNLLETLSKDISVEGNNRELIPFVGPPEKEKKSVPVACCSRAIVPVVEAVAVFPVEQKPKRCEMGQRRTRRPFSVGEVEALVHAVEKLGTGRWRDVKLSAFENAKHRTYVDLKDKWKTLVHTARISPQQRRGEPVPQELLDRVLAAHAYWSQHQPKQHVKQHSQAVPLAMEKVVAA